MKIQKTSIIFFGTPDFAIPSLEALAKASFCDIKGVVTQPDKPVGRHQSKPAPSSVKQACQRLKLPVFEGLDSLKDIEADLGIVVAYGEILPQWLLDRFPLGIVNMHPSLLPKYRGSSPIQAAILNRDKKTGVTLIKLDGKIDHGPIIAQETYPLPAPEPPLTPPLVKGENKKRSSPNSLPLLRGGLGWGLTAGELHDQLSQISARMLIKYLPDFIAGKIKLKPQDDNLATFTKKLTKEDGQIDWKKSSQEIEAHVRAMNPWPGAWTMWRSKRLIIWRASLPRHPDRAVVLGGEWRDLEGYPRDSSTSLRSARNDGLILQEVQLEGKKRMPLKEFLKGHPDFDLANVFSW